jgi:uncharacterized protein YecE (DUF72 family)
MNHARSVWNKFWMGFDGRGGYNIFHQEGKLGYFLLSFPSSFSCSNSNIKKLESYHKLFPSDVRFAFEFKNGSWWLAENTECIHKFFSDKKNLCMVYPYIQNRIIEADWCGDMPSSKVNVDPLMTYDTTDFTVFNFYGTLGEYMGSYDDHGYLEKILEKIKVRFKNGVKHVFCCFFNTKTSYKYPIPITTVMGLPLCPELKKLPDYQPLNLACGLHDALRLKSIWNEERDLDDEGFIKVEFC